MTALKQTLFLRIFFVFLHVHLLHVSTKWWKTEHFADKTLQNFDYQPPNYLSKHHIHCFYLLSSNSCVFTAEIISHYKFCQQGLDLCKMLKWTLYQIILTHISQPCYKCFLVLPQKVVKKLEYYPCVTFYVQNNCLSFMPSNSHYVPPRG